MTQEADNEKCDIKAVSADGLRDRVRVLRDQGHRLVAISATRLPDEMELTYSFDLDGKLTNLRLFLPGEDTQLPSISTIYGCAILYENEIHDLFGVHVDGLTVDFKGNLYKTTVKHPFGSTKSPCAAPAPAPAETP